MKKIKLLGSTIFVIIAFNIITVHLNIEASDMSLNITNSIAIAEADYPPLRPCYTDTGYGGIVGLWKCIPCVFMSFARPWGDFSYCMQG